MNTAMTTPELPRNGLLSGMLLTWGGAILAVGVGLFLPEQAARLSTHPPDALILGLGVTVALMAAHKAESWLLGEFDRCPVYLNLGRGSSWQRAPRRSFFVGFVGTLLGMLALVTLVMWGRAWPMLLLFIWMAQGQHELHHLGKSIAERRYYPGTVSGLAFAAGVDALIVPGWLANAGLPAAWLQAWVGAHALVLGAFVLEHQRWLGRGGAAFVGLAPSA